MSDEQARVDLAERLEARADNPPHAEDARVETGVVCESCERPQFVGDEGWEGDGEGLDHCPRCWINAPTASELAREECLMLIDKHEDGDGMTFTTDEVEVLKRALHPHRREQPMTDTAPQEGSRVSVIAEAILADAALMHPHPDVEETTGLAYEAAERIDAALRTSTEQGAARVEGLRLTHGRHCPCSACAQQDWSEPELAPCGMHGPSCPPRYAPYHGLSVGDPAPAPDVPGSMEPDRLPFEADDYGAH